jgi:hypothetical protein
MMSVKTIHLQKLLTIFYAPPRKQKALLRADIRTEIGKNSGENTNGGHFHVPFWTDVKNHVAGKVDLRERTEFRIARNEIRKRLYPQLCDGFLKWWNEKRRWRNEAFEFLPLSVRARFSIPELGTTVKVENLLSLKIGDDTNRIIYPYFSEDPELPEEGARVGLWLLSQALPAYHVDDIRILDILRSTSFSTIDCPLQGNEHRLFLQHYKRVLTEWAELRKEYA